MCELFALNAEGPVNTNAYLREFFSHSVNHPHGWGISWRDGDPFDDASVTLVREDPGLPHREEPRPRPHTLCHGH